MPDIRRKAEVLAAIASLTTEQHNRLRVEGASNSKYWNDDGEDATLIATFRAELKRYYYFRQRRLCCYCSKTLDEHQATYDAEHILDKDMHPQFMFEPENLAAACKTCNGAKSNKCVLGTIVALVAIPAESDCYVIVHPHLDEWQDHLAYDGIGRVLPKVDSSKGTMTIEICGINYLNSARLADHFCPGDNEAAQRALEGYYRVKSVTWKRKYLKILRTIADDYDLAQAKSIVDLLETDI
jgi:hypothetical protein